jgi:hypothetical protein
MHAVHCCLVCFAMPQYSSSGARQAGETKALSCCRKNMSSTSCLFFLKKENSVYYVHNMKQLQSTINHSPKASE